ncbi:hypothetical protein F6455_12430 [Proteobacteria bacterium 005FR1]|nr:hypothetical protein [Proteobacteria bacterium 005FR1]
MRQEMRIIDRWVDEAVAAGDFPSREDCVDAMLNWLVLNQHVNPSDLGKPPRSAGDRSESVDDRHANGVSEPEEALLQYEILRDRDA